MSENPCDRLIEKTNEAAHEWIMWSKRAGYPPSFTPP